MTRTKWELNLCSVRGCRDPALSYPKAKESGRIKLCPRHAEKAVKEGVI